MGSDLVLNRLCSQLGTSSGAEMGLLQAYLFKGEIEWPLMNIVIRPPKDMAMVIDHKFISFIKTIKSVN